MIRFSCVYCGARLQGPDRVARTRARCPACRHWIRVRPDLPPRLPQPSIEEPPQDSVATAEPFWEGMTNEEIIGYAREKTRMAEQRRAQEVLRRELEAQRRRQVARRYISLSCARYDDLTLFTLSFTLLLLLTLNIQIWRDLAILVLVVQEIGIIVMLAGVGMVLSLLSLIHQRERTEVEKHCMLLLAVLIPAAAGAYSGWAILKDSPRWLMIFPAWNILSSGVLVFMWCTGFITTDSITGERPSTRLFLVTAASATLLLLLCQYAFKLHWAISFSVTVCYTLSLQSVLREYFPATRGVSLAD